MRPEGTATAGDIWRFPVDELIVVRQFGEPIFPALIPLASVENGPADAPWHVLIEADNFHALQALHYLYAGQVDCIYIDPPYNTGARDWKCEAAPIPGERIGPVSSSRSGSTLKRRRSSRSEIRCRSINSLI